MSMLKVSAQSNAIRAAGALANTIRQRGEAEIQAIGPKAVNQTVKAIAIARSYLASSGVDLVAIPSFVDVEIEGEPRTAVRFHVVPRHRLIEAAKAAAETGATTAAPSPPSTPTPTPTATDPGSGSGVVPPERTSAPPPEVLAGTGPSAEAPEREAGADARPDATVEPPHSGSQTAWGWTEQPAEEPPSESSDSEGDRGIPDLERKDS